VLTLAGAVAATTAACSSSHPTASAAATSSAATRGQDCTDVSDVLSDGPDPSADAVGYAQAQILPLKQLALGDDAALRTAVDRLDTAFGTFVGADGSARAQSAAQVTSAENALNVLCPGVAP